MTCSFAWDAAQLPAWGSAPRANFWLALEQPGPWGAKTFTQSRLDPDVGAQLEQATLAAGGRSLLIRRPSSRIDMAVDPVRQVYVAGGLATRPWLVAGAVRDPTVILDLPWAELACASAARVAAQVAWLEVLTGGVLLVCANAKRDVCCALRGRPIALKAEQARPGQVWECSHTGGHRFAPTGVVLPSGQALARLTPDLALAALDAADSERLAAQGFGAWHDRGRGHLSPQEAVAEACVRELCGETDPGALTTRPVLPEVEVRHRDGRVWIVDVSLDAYPEALPESCGKAAVTARSWTAEVVAHPSTANARPTPFRSPDSASGT